MTTNIVDAVTLKDGRLAKTEEGYLVADAFVARTGVQQYLGKEVGRPDLQTVTVYRDEAEVFKESSLQTFAGIPITVEHPPVMVDANNSDQYSKGHTGEGVLRDGEYLKIGIKITDASTVKAVEDGKRELSVGYSTVLKWDAGVAPDGTPYQARQTDIKANHIAIVDRGRAGPRARIGDGALPWGASPVTDADKKEGFMPDTLRKILVDGLQVETTDSGAQAIEKLQGQLEAKDKQISDAATSHQQALAAKDTELAKKDAEIDELKGKILSDADIDKRVADRAKLVDQARSIVSDVKVDGIADDDIRKAVVQKMVGDAAVTDRSVDYINARFDTLVEAADKTKSDPFAKSLAGNPLTTGDALSTAYQKRDAALNDAWKGEAK